MTDFLASVSSVEEALLVEQLGADIIDLKNPKTGALGALSTDQMSAIIAALKANTLVSATIGDLPMIPNIILSAVQQTAATGVDFIKIGLFNDGNIKSCLDVLTPEIERNNLSVIGVLFADQSFHPDLLENLSLNGFQGVMLDTANKSKGPLTSIISRQVLGSFISNARRHQLFCGLAGSLTPIDIHPLIQLNPDYLGFRSALCEQSNRIAKLNSENIRTVRHQINFEKQLIAGNITKTHAI